MRIKKVFIVVLAIALACSLFACTDSKDVKNPNEGITQNKEQNENQNSTSTDEGVKENNDSQVNYPLNITDSYDREVTIEKEPQTVISIAPSITETIFVLGAQDKLIGRTDYCTYPEETKNIESIGGLTDPSIERITELNPDLIIASTHFKEEVLEKLEEVGMKVIVLYGEESFDGAYELIEKMGTVLNAKDKADEFVTGMKNKVANVLEKVKDKDKPSVYYVVGFGQYGDFTAGKDTFIGQMIEMAGGKNAADDVEGWEYSLERLVENNPDILICSLNDNHKEQLLEANGYKDLDAVKNGKLYEIDKSIIELQGPRLAEGLEQLARIIHPDEFE